MAQPGPAGVRRKRAAALPEDAPKKSGERLAKRIARAGLCSRREAERWILEGRVSVDGRKVTTPALDVVQNQAITVDGKALPDQEPTRLFRYHKPRGVVTTSNDPEGRPTVAQTLPPDLPRLMPIGRLDINTEGLLLLTNDGEVKRRLELPATGWLRRYRVRAFGNITDEKLAELKDGVVVEGVAYGPIEARLDKVQGDNVWITMALREGKNREVRRVLEHLGLQVNRLIRLSYGPFQLGSLDKRMVEEVPRKALREQLGIKAEPRPPRTRQKARTGE
jgi:23S rRNA pseudouridine2605 synthase